MWNSKASVTGELSASRAGREWSTADYRQYTCSNGLASFEICIEQTDMRVAAELNLEREVRALVLEARSQIKQYIAQHPRFLTTLVPLDVDVNAGQVVNDMAKAARQAYVGPMAAV